MSSNFPKSPAELTCEFLSSVVGKPVESFNVSETALQGACSCVFEVKLDLGSSFPPKLLICKFPLPDDEETLRNGHVNRDLLVSVAAYRKEIALYQYILAGWDDRLRELTPKVLFAEINCQQRDQFLLIMEPGGEPLNQLAEQSIDSDISRVAVAQLARFHAAFVNVSDETLQERGMACALHPAHVVLARGVRLDGSLASEAIRSHCIDNFLENYRNFSHVVTALNDQELVELCELNLTPINLSQVSGIFAQVFDELFAPSCQWKTLIHGDFRLDNLLLDKYSGSIVRIIDFQAICRGSPIYDLAQFILQSHSHEQLVSENFFQELVIIYYNTFLENAPHTMISQNHHLNLPIFLKQVKSAAILQLVMMVFHVAPLKNSIDSETGKLPESLGRFIPLISNLSKRAVEAFKFCCSKE